MKAEIVEKLIGMAIAKHGCVISPTNADTFNKSCTWLYGGIAALWYDFPVKDGYSSGVVTMEVAG